MIEREIGTHGVFCIYEVTFSAAAARIGGEKRERVRCSIMAKHRQYAVQKYAYGQAHG